MEKKKVLLLALALPLSYIPGHTATLCSQIENSSYSLHQTTIQSAQMINPTTGRNSLFGYNTAYSRFLW